MRKRIRLFALLMACLMLCSCGKKKQENSQAEKPKDEVVFEKNQTILGVDVGNMSLDEAVKAIQAAVDAYELEAMVNENTFTVKAEEVALTVSEDSVRAYLQAQQDQNPDVPAPVAEFDQELLEKRIKKGANSTVSNATVVYSPNASAFVINKEREGVTVDVPEVIKQITPILQNLTKTCNIQVQEVTAQPDIKSDDPRVIAARDRANTYLDISLTYRFAPEKVSAKNHTVTRNDIGKLIGFEDLTPYVSKSAVEEYVAKLVDKYNVYDQFKTTGGVYLNINFGEVLQAVDSAKLVADIKSCLENGTGGTRNAPYGPRKESTGVNLNNYVEVDLTGQHLWVYKDGKCVVSTPIVSGCVSENYETITGVYSIYSMAQDTYLTGPTWNSFVKYWMAFSGGYGLHDASWRSEFGGEIYLYNGSHGCVNIPPSAAGQVYSNVSVGTKVILYGGATDVEHKPQNFTGTTSYSVAPGAAPFNLDIKASGKVTLSYTSNNTAVATVSSTGTVTIQGVGTAVITVTSSAADGYDAGSIQVTITVGCSGGHKLTWVTTVQPSCTEGKQVGTCACGYTETKTLAATQSHTYENWTQTKAPTCVAGEETGTCSCGATSTRPLDPVQDHSYGNWEVTTAPGCETAGTQSATCGGCGHTKTETLPSTGHDFSGGDTCSGCGTTQ